MKGALSRLALALILLLGGLIGLFARGDGKPPDDADLMETAAPIPEHENGYITLSAASELLVWPEDEAGSGRWIQLSRDEDWDERLAAQAISANAYALSALARVTKAPAFQTPPIRDIANDAVPDMLRWRQLSRVSAIRAIAEARRGDEGAALADALAPLKLAQQMASDANATVMHAMVALSVGATGLDALDALLPMSRVDRESARAIAAQVGTHRIDGSAWAKMWAGEYRAMRGTVLGWGDEAKVREMLEDAATPRIARWLPTEYLFQPNNSLAVYGAIIRGRQARAGGPCSAEERRGKSRPAFALLAPNYLGKREVADAADLAVYDARRCLYDTRIEALRAAIAVRAFEAERGLLPPSLAALVPEYLESLPRDEFADGELRLDRVGRALYSIGTESGLAPERAAEARFPLLPPPAEPGA